MVVSFSAYPINTNHRNPEEKSLKRARLMSPTTLLFVMTSQRKSAVESHFYRSKQLISLEQHQWLQILKRRMWSMRQLSYTGHRSCSRISELRDQLTKSMSSWLASSRNVYKSFNVMRRAGQSSSMLSNKLSPSQSIPSSQITSWTNLVFSRSHRILLRLERCKNTSKSANKKPGTGLMSYFTTRRQALLIANIGLC